MSVALFAGIPLNAGKRMLVADAIAEILPTPSDGCGACDPSGGCPNDFDCRLELAERVLALIERETGRPL